MRDELKSLLLLAWEKEVPGGYKVHVDSVIAMKLTPDERIEICEMLDEHEDKSIVYTLTGVMYCEPDQVYRDALVRALDSSNWKKRFLAMRALLRGGYEGALELLFSKPAVQEAMGDEFPWDLWGLAEELTEEMQRRVLVLFRKRFTPIPQLEIRTRQWLRMLAGLSVTDEQTVQILLEIWNDLSPRDSQDRFLVLQAMAVNADPRYEEAFRKAGKSTVEDIRDLGRVGLAILAGKIDLDAFRKPERDLARGLTQQGRLRRRRRRK